MSSHRMLILGLTLALALPAAAQAKPKPTRYLVSLGDSYATGYQATGVDQGQNTRSGSPLAPRQGRSGDDLDRGQRRHRVRARGRSDPVRRRSGAGDRAQRDRD